MTQSQEAGQTAVADLAENPRNPRKAWKADQIDAFKESLRRFGDLGGIVMNRTTGQLVGGHKRVEVLKAGVGAEIVKTEQAEDAQGTVAHGYVVLPDGSRFAYREVCWSPAIEAAANLAANRWSADWNWQLVSETLQELSATDLLPYTGFPQHELENLVAADWTPAVTDPLATADDADVDGHTVHMTQEQYEVLLRAKQRIQDNTPGPITDGRVVELVCAEFLSGV